MKRTFIIVFLLFFFLFTSCGKKTINKPVIGSTEMKSKTGKIYKITEYISEDSISYDYTIKGIGFLNSNDSVEILKQFPLFKTLFVDLDFNGFEELYLVTKSVDKGLIVVRGIASYDDKTFGSINVEGSTKSNALFNDVLMLEKPTRLWYLGNDSIFFTIGRIMIKKPIQSLGSNPNFHDTYVSMITDLF